MWTLLDSGPHEIKVGLGFELRQILFRKAAMFATRGEDPEIRISPEIGRKKSTNSDKPRNQENLKSGKGMGQKPEVVPTDDFSFCWLKSRDIFNR